MATTLSNLPERALQLATHVGEGLRDAVPNKAIKWVETGAALGALRTGTRVATKLVKRNPAIAVAAVAGAGLLWYAARRKARRDANGSGDGEAIEGRATRVEARRGDGRTTRARGTGTRAKRKPAANH